MDAARERVSAAAAAFAGRKRPRSTFEGGAGAGAMDISPNCTKVGMVPNVTLEDMTTICAEVGPKGSQPNKGIKIPNIRRGARSVV